MLFSGGEFPTVFTKAQVDVFAFEFLRLRNNGMHIAMVFWGLWLFPFGRLVIRSGYFPKVLGILLLIAGFAYLTVGLTSIALPNYSRIVSSVMMPLFFAEPPIIPWLLAVGVREREHHNQAFIAERRLQL